MFLKRIFSAKSFSNDAIVSLDLWIFQEYYSCFLLEVLVGGLIESLHRQEVAGMRLLLCGSQYVNLSL